MFTVIMFILQVRFQATEANLAPEASSRLSNVTQRKNTIVIRCINKTALVVVPICTTTPAWVTNNGVLR